MTHPDRHAHVLALTVVSKTIRKESLLLSFEVNKFEFYCSRRARQCSPFIAHACYKKDLALLRRWPQGLMAFGVKRLDHLSIYQST